MLPSPASSDFRPRSRLLSHCTYGHKPDLCARDYDLGRSPRPAYPEGSVQQLLSDLPLLNFLVLEEGLSSLPKHWQQLAILASASGAALLDEWREKLHRPGLRGLLRFIAWCNSLHRAIGWRDWRSNEMGIFLRKR